jgi:hypothetical protein
MNGNLPDGVEMGLDFYVVSDEAGVEAVFSVKGLPKYPDWSITPEIEPLAILMALGQPIEPLRALADDWRMMTRSEVYDYKRRARDEQIEDRRRKSEEIEEW